MTAVQPALLVKPPSVFSPLTAVMLVLVAAFALSAFVVLSAYAPDLRGGQNGGEHAMSRAGVGFSAMPELLRLQGREAVVIRRAPTQGSRGILVLTPSQNTSPEAIRDLHFDGPILIVLPKWEVGPLPSHQGWVQRAGDTPPEIIAQSLSGLDATTQIARRTGSSRPILRQDGQSIPQPATINRLQTISGESWTPIVVDETGAAVLAQSNKSLTYVLADPDLMNNAGLRDLQTARTAMRILSVVQRDDGPVMFDVSLNGFGASSSLLRLLFDPPFLAVTLCLTAAGTLMGIHAISRFGPARAPQRDIAFGGQALADNTAQLIRLAGREASMGPRYAALVQSLTAKALAAPKDLAPAAVTEVLDRMASQRGAADRLGALTQIAGVVRRRDELLTIAQRLHRWRLEMTREHH